MLFPSTLFITSEEFDILPHIQYLGHLTILNNPDILVIDDYKIEKIKEIRLFLSNAPYSHSSKIVYIQYAHLLGTEAQNALLKNLEEPGKDNYLILTSPNTSSLIPTIISRCQVIKISSNFKNNFQILTPKQVLKENLFLADSLVADKDSLLKYLQSQIDLYHHKLLESPDIKTTNFIGQLTKAIQMLRANVDPKSTLDFLLLS